jgi:hypothetical protein
MRQKKAILLDSVNLVQAQNCQVDLAHALGSNCLDQNICVGKASNESKTP